MTHTKPAVKTIVGLVIGLVMATSVFAGMGGPRQEEVYIPDVDKESFIWQVPAKWYPFSNESDKKIDAYLFPTGQNPKKHKQFLHFAEYKSTMGVTEAKTLYKLRTDGAASTCATYNQELDVERQENGYSMAQWSESCTSEDGSTLESITKAVVGNEKLYVAKKAWKFKPKESESNKWQNYLRSVYVCDPTTPGLNPCRPPNRPGRGGERPQR